MADNSRTDDMLTVREVARMLHVHPNTLRRWSNCGKIKCYHITSRGDRRYKRSDLARFIADLNISTGASEKDVIKNKPNDILD